MVSQNAQQVSSAPKLRFDTSDKVTSTRPDRNRFSEAICLFRVVGDVKRDLVMV